MIEQLAAVSAGIGLLIEYVKPGLKWVKARLALSDFHYQVMVYLMAGLIAAGIVFTHPGQWDFLRESSVFGYPQWLGNVLAIVALAGGNSITHTILEILKRISQTDNPEPEGPAVG